MIQHHVLSNPGQAKALTGPQWPLVCVRGEKKQQNSFKKDEDELDCDSQMILRFGKCICSNNSNLFPPKG